MARCQTFGEQEMMFNILNYTQKQTNGWDGWISAFLILALPT